MASFQAFGIFLLLVFTASLCHALQDGKSKLKISRFYFNSINIQCGQSMSQRKPSSLKSLYSIKGRLTLGNRRDFQLPFYIYLSCFDGFGLLNYPNNFMT